MKALVTGVAGFIGSTLAERLLDDGRRRDRDRLLHRLLPAADQGAEPGRRSGGVRGFGFVESTIQDADLPTLLDGVDARLPPGRAGRACARAGAATSRSTPSNNVEATQVLLEACCRAAHRALRVRVELVGLRRPGRHPDARGRAAAAGVAVRRHQAGGRAALLPLPRELRRADRRRCGTSRSTARASGPTWASTGSSAPPLRGEPITLYGDGEQTRDFTFVADAVAATMARRPAGRPGARVQYRRRVARLDQPRARHHRRDSWPAGSSRAPRAGAEGRHAATPTPTRPAPAGHSASPRPSRSSRASKPSSAGCRRCRTCSESLRATSRSARRMSVPNGDGSRLRCWLSRPAAAAAAPRRERRPDRACSKPTSSSSTAATELLGKKKWFQAREYFRQLVDNYPQSTYRPDAKLGLGDTYLGENTAESLVLAQNEFREFLTFYPTNPRADYAQFKLGDEPLQADARAGPRPDRNEEAVAELNAFVAALSEQRAAREGRKGCASARTG